jgi:hypothetical protein
VIFSPRRIPGTLALAGTNLIAAWSVIDDQAFRVSPLFSSARSLMPVWAWAALFALSAAGMIAAALARSLTLLHIFGGLSFCLWTIIITGILWMKYVDRDLVVSPIALGLFFWALAGQASMLLAPLWHPPAKWWRK